MNTTTSSSITELLQRFEPESWASPPTSSPTTSNARWVGQAGVGPGVDARIVIGAQQATGSRQL